MYAFPNLETVHCSMSGSNFYLLNSIHISQEMGKVVWCSHLSKNFPQFVAIHTVKGFGVTVPLPTEIKGNTIHVVALDEDGQLEKLASTLEAKDGKNYIKFSTNHLSVFAIYALGEDGSVQVADGNVTYTTPSSKKDYSPNTGDYSIHPKWFVAIGMSALAIALIAYKPKRRRR